MNGLAFEERRREMVEHQLRGRGIVDPLVLDAMGCVPREEFVPEVLKGEAYQDRPLSIGCGQTISQPYIVAFMVQALELRGGETVLEVGTGSGYAAAVLAQIAAQVYSIERLPELAERARDTLLRQELANVHLRCGDGTLGWLEEAPFDAIVVAAGSPVVPPSLKSQLKVGGRLVIPVGGEETSQELVRVTRRTESHFEQEWLVGVRFVPLIGDEGWN